jgi:hypothetical protein
VSLPSDEFGALRGGKGGPGRLQVVASQGPISLAVIFVFVSWGSGLE